MRIGIDARFFGPQERGLGRYVERLITYLEAIDEQNEYVLFLRRASWDLWQPKNARWRKIMTDYRWYTVAEQLAMPAIFRSARVDFVHIPHFNVPVLYRGPFVVTIHDLILHDFPTARASTLEPIRFKMKFAAYEYALRRAITRARSIITVSQYVKADIAKKFRVPESKIVVTYEAADPLLNPAPFERLAERGVTQPYILYVGNVYPHKNLERFLLGVQRAVQHGERFQLVLAGGRDYFSRRLETLRNELKLSNVHFFGFASDQELAALYAHATAYFFPSLSEGFGLPGLEAMQAGLPVYAARASCLPEVYGPAAAYFDPRDPADMAASISRALHDTMERQRLRAAGQERVRQFSWAQMARQTLALYERTYADRKTKINRPEPKRS